MSTKRDDIAAVLPIERYPRCFASERGGVCKPR
jgi:hypothetical protein